MKVMQVKGFCFNPAKKRYFRRIRNRGVTVNKIDIPMLLLASFVILSFAAVGFAIALRSVWLTLILIIVGFSAMAYGISLKKKKKK